MYKLTEEQVKTIISILENVPAQGKMAELETFIKRNKDIINALKNPIKEK